MHVAYHKFYSFIQLFPLQNEAVFICDNHESSLEKNTVFHRCVEITQTDHFFTKT